MKTIQLISWSFTEPWIIFAIDNVRYRYEFAGTRVVDDILWMCKHNHLWQALNSAKRHAMKSEKLP